MVEMEWNGRRSASAHLEAFAPPQKKKKTDFKPPYTNHRKTVALYALGVTPAPAQAPVPLLAYECNPAPPAPGPDRVTARRRSMESGSSRCSEKHKGRQDTNQMSERQAWPYQDASC